MRHRSRTLTRVKVYLPSGSRPAASLTLRRRTSALPDRHYQELVERYAAADREAQRDTRWAWLRVLGEIVLWTAIGLAGIALALHSPDVRAGWIWFWAGETLWFGGVSVAMGRAYKRGEERGDW